MIFTRRKLFINTVHTQVIVKTTQLTETKQKDENMITQYCGIIMPRQKTQKRRRRREREAGYVETQFVYHSQTSLARAGLDVCTSPGGVTQIITYSSFTQSEPPSSVLRPHSSGYISGSRLSC